MEDFDSIVKNTDNTMEGFFSKSVKHKPSNLLESFNKENIDYNSMINNKNGGNREIVNGEGVGNG
jgi:hypothetical protein